MITDDFLPLTVTIPATEYAFLTRRARYLEAVAVQVLRDHRRLREWYRAADLIALGLPGLPRSTQALRRQAKREGWLCRDDAPSSGGRGREYHCAALPARAFDALVARILTVAPPMEDGAAPAMPSCPAPATATERSTAKPPRAETAAPWLLPLLRVIRLYDKLSVAGAVAALPEHLPPGVPCPSYDEAEAALRALGMVSGI